MSVCVLIVILSLLGTDDDRKYSAHVVKIQLKLFETHSLVLVVVLLRELLNQKVHKFLTKRAKVLIIKA